MSINYIDSASDVTDSFTFDTAATGNKYRYEAIVINGSNDQIIAVGRAIDGPEYLQKILITVISMTIDTGTFKWGPLASAALSVSPPA